ncbi:MAG: hypothetical protein WC840_07110 [Candidatus Peribacteraceae bacterium]
MKKFTIAVLCLSLLLAACGKQPIQPTASDTEKLQKYATVSRKPGEVRDPVHGKEIGFWYGAVTGINRVNANGVGLLRRFQDGTSTATVNLNILKAPVKKFHVVWLSDATWTESVRVGALQSIVGDSRHSVSFETKEDLTGLTTVLVSLESSSDPEKPGSVREAEGTLREVKK